jgi:hypothetical protein
MYRSASFLALRLVGQIVLPFVLAVRLERCVEAVVGSHKAKVHSDDLLFRHVQQSGNLGGSLRLEVFLDGEPHLALQPATIEEEVLLHVGGAHPDLTLEKNRRQICAGSDRYRQYSLARR